MKKTSTFIALMFLILIASLYGTDLTKSVPVFKKNVTSVIKTEYFDIIYPSLSSEIACNISKTIDNLYLDIRRDLHAESYALWKNFPVVLLPSHDETNAYYATGPYNVIVLYDTPPSENLAVFSENLKSILYHELVHAVTLNMKNDFTQTESYIFGDFMSNQFYTAPASVLEGAAVALESSNGEGRLNDSFSTHILKQAKIEGRFPSWHEITGARDLYPSGVLPYIFGGEFTSFIQKKYGMEKYSKLWDTVINTPLIYFWAFQKVYGVSLNDAWSDFEDSIDVSNIITNVNDIEGYSDFFTQKKYSQNNKRARLINPTSWISGKKSGGIAWIDSSTGAVFLETKIDDATLSRPKKLFTMSGIMSIAFSPDGKYLAFSKRTLYQTPKNTVGIYNVKSKKFFYVNEPSLRNPCVVIDKNGNSYLAAVSTQSQFCKIKFFKIIEKNSGKTEKLLPMGFSVDFPFGKVPYSLTPTGDGSLAYLYHDANNWSIRIYDIIEKSSTEYSLADKNISFRNLSGIIAGGFTGGQKGVLLSFSWGKLENLPRLGYLAIEKNKTQNNATWFLQEKDITGGIHYPVAFPLSSSKKLPSVAFISKKYLEYDLKVLNADKISFAKQSAISKSINIDSEKQNEKNNDDENIKIKVERYNPFSYATKRILLPFSIVPTYKADLNLSWLLPLGLTWVSAPPNHSYFYLASAGYDFFTNSFGALLYLTNETEQKLFTYKAHGTLCADGNGFLQSFASLELNANIPVLTHSKINVKNKTSFFYGYNIDTPNLFSLKAFNNPKKENCFLTSDNTTSILFNTLHKTGSGLYDIAGVYFGPKISFSHVENKTFQKSKPYGNVGFILGFNLPQLLPFENPNGFTLNLPFALESSIFSSYKNFAELSTKIYLFASEIQKGTKYCILPLYANRILLSAGYNANLMYCEAKSFGIQNTQNILNGKEKLFYNDSVYAGLDFYGKINTGFFTDILLDLSVQVLYDLRSSTNSYPWHLKLCSILVF